METVFLQILGMSITACYVILLVILVRLPMKKIPRVFSYFLWVAVLFRLICPLSIENPASLIPSSDTNLSVIVQKITGEQVSIKKNQIGFWENEQSGTSETANSRSAVDGSAGTAGPSGDSVEGLSAHTLMANEMAAGPEQSTNLMPFGDGIRQGNWIFAGAVLWLTGAALLLLYSIYTAVKLKQRLKNARNTEENVYELEGLETPFVFGFFHPLIFLPVGISGVARSCILDHERIHIRRMDHVVKPIAYVVLCIHWFNPLVWLAYHLMCEDMEFSCDESVLRKRGSAIRKEYSRSLVALSGGKRFAAGGPLAFGENQVKGRIKNILNYRKPGRAVIVIAVIVVAALSVGLISNPKSHTLTIDDYAERFVNEQIDLYHQSDYVGFRITESRITRLEKLDEFDFMLDVPVEIWNIEYRLKPDDPSKVMIAGGMGIVDGWLTEESSMGKPLLVFAMEKEGPQFLGSMNTGDGINGNIDTKAGLETMLRSYLENQDLIAHETYAGEHIVMKFPLSTGETCQLLLSRPVTKDDSGIWCVERWMDGNGTVYYDTPKANSTALAYFTQLQERVEAGQELWRLDPIAVSLDYINNTLGQHVTADELEPQYDAEPADFEKTPESHYIGYISNWKTYSDRQGAFAFHLDAVEWLTLDDTKRLAELKINTDELPNGFYIYNANTYPGYYQGTEKTTFRITNRKTGVGYEEVSMEEFQQYLESFSEKETVASHLFRIVTKDGYVQSIQEQYLP